MLPRPIPSPRPPPPSPTPDRPSPPEPKASPISAPHMLPCALWSVGVAAAAPRQEHSGSPAGQLQAAELAEGFAAPPAGRDFDASSSSGAAAVAAGAACGG